MTQNSVSFSCQGKQVSRCCITFPHELICQISTNQCITMGRRARPWWEKQLLTCLFKRAVFSRPKSVWNQNCVAHKHILFPVHWKNWTWACDHLKTSNLSADNKKSRTRWVDNCAHDTVMWYCPADILFWKLSIGHNMDVQYKVAGSQNKLERVRFNFGFPVVRTGGWLYGQVTSKFSRTER